MNVNDRRDIDAVTRDLFMRLDPGGALGDQIRAFTPVVNSRLGRGLLRLLKVDIGELERLVSAPGELVGSMAEAVLTFGPAGWAPSSRSPVVPYQTALRVYQETQSLEQAEAILVEAWNQPHRLPVVLKPLGYMGAAHPPLRDVFQRRAVLIDKALSHHRAGAYEASVPITLAQLDGVVGDLLPGQLSFFHGKNQAEHLVDNETVAGLPEGLELLRKLVATSSFETGDTGKLSRHSIMHGRELGYDTLINSTKTFVLLLAVMDWAMPRAHELALRRHAEYEAMHTKQRD